MLVGAVGCGNVAEVDDSVPLGVPAGSDKLIEDDGAVLLIELARKVWLYGDTSS